jgi:hypothetical protein
LVMGEDFPSWFGLEDGEGGRRHFFRENDFQVDSLRTGYRVRGHNRARSTELRTALSGKMGWCVQFDCGSSGGGCGGGTAVTPGSPDAAAGNGFAIRLKRIWGRYAER